MKPYFDLRSSSLLLFLLFRLTAWGQETKSSDIPQDYINSSIQSMSPQTSSMIRYDNLSSALNTGRLDLNIPVIHFEDPDFELPISIRYDSKGPVPGDIDNFVGEIGH